VVGIVNIRNMIFILFPLVLLAENSTMMDMLQTLRQKSELHHQTIKEEAGIVTVYSREDLDRMQARTLKDILKSTTFFTYQEGIVGTPSIVVASHATTYVPMYRLYIDDHEVSSTYFGSAFYIYGDMALGFVDHIEIYQGGNAIEFGIEPSIHTIKIYTKKPERENGVVVDLMMGRHYATSGSIYSGEEYNQMQVGAYVSYNNHKRPTYMNDGVDLSKDNTKRHLLATLEGESFSLLASRYDVLQDGFGGYGTNKQPTGTNEIDKYHQFIDMRYKLNDAYQCYISIDDSSSRMNFYEEDGYNRGQSSHYVSEWQEDIYKVGLKSQQHHKNHQIAYGIEWAQKKLNPIQSEYDGVSTLDIAGLTQVDIGSLYFEDRYEMTPKVDVIATLQLNHYDTSFDTTTTPLMRLGYLHYINTHSSVKLFLNRTSIFPSFIYTTTFSGKTSINPHLSPVKIDSLITEYHYKNDRYEIEVGMAYFNNQDIVIYDSTAKHYINGASSIYTTAIFARINYQLDLYNHISMNFYKKRNSMYVVESSNKGAMFRVLNQFGQWDIFNELVYRSAYSYNDINIDTGLDYSMGVTYSMDPQLTLKVKGENLFNKASKTPLRNLGAVESIDKTLMVGLEYQF
jgi:vitamin B12 transporter